MFRIGTTSYILPADILPNVEYLAPLVDDVELVLFETDEYGSNLPDAALCRRLREIAATHALTYTVHMPLDLRLGRPGPELDLSLRKARRVIDATSELEPFAYVAHLDGRSLQEPGGQSGPALAEWQADARGALATVTGWLDDPGALCIENLEAWPPEAFAPVLDDVPAGRTIDIGHLWLMGIEPLSRLPGWIARARVIHLHGIGARDHLSLAQMPVEQIDPVTAFLMEHFSGVVTLEVFNESDFHASLAALRGSIERCGGA